MLLYLIVVVVLGIVLVGGSIESWESLRFTWMTSKVTFAGQVLWTAVTVYFLLEYLNSDMYDWLEQFTCVSFAMAFNAIGLQTLERWNRASRDREATYIKAMKTYSDRHY